MCRVDVCGPRLPFQVACAFDAAIGDNDKSISEVREQQGERHTNWLKRSSTTTQNWRPQKKHRKSACSWLRYLDNQALLGVLRGPQRARCRRVPPYSGTSEPESRLNRFLYLS